MAYAGGEDPTTFFNHDPESDTESDSSHNARRSRPATPSSSTATTPRLQVQSILS